MNNVPECNPELTLAEAKADLETYRVLLSIKEDDLKSAQAVVDKIKGWIEETKEFIKGEENG